MVEFGKLTKRSRIPVQKTIAVSAKLPSIPRKKAFEHRKSLPQSRVPGLPNNSKIPVPVSLTSGQHGESTAKEVVTAKTTTTFKDAMVIPNNTPNKSSSTVLNDKPELTPILEEKKAIEVSMKETQTELEKKEAVDCSIQCRPAILTFGTQTITSELEPEVITEDKAIMAQIIEIVDEEDSTSAADKKRIEQLEAENARLREQAQRLEERAMRLEDEASTSRTGHEALLAEIENLKQQVQEANTYVDQVDVEAEQQYTELSSEIDELIELVQKKDAEIAILKTQMADKQKEEGKQNENVERERAQIQRHKEIIESLREELDAEIVKTGQLQKEREKLMKEMVQAKEKMSQTVLAKEALISIQLDDLHRELDKQKTIINGTSVAQIVNKWEQRVEALENSLRERDVIIHTQSQLIKELRRGTQTPSPNLLSAHSSNSNNNNLHRHSSMNAGQHKGRRHASASNNSSMDSFYRDALDSRSRDQLLNFIMSDRPSQLANIFNVGRILDLNPQEEKLLERFLARETYG